MSVAVIILEKSDLDLTSRLQNQVIYELRIDEDQDLLESIDDLLEKNLKLILTLRSKKEGGKFSGNSETLLKDMMNFPVNYVDFEIERDSNMLKNLKSLKKSPETTVILSKHDYKQPMINTLKNFITENKDLNPQNQFVIKFVGKPIDSYDMLKSLIKAKSVFPRSVILGVGNHGLLSRTLLRDFNQEFAFGMTDSDEAIPSYNELIDANNHNSLLTGLLGQSLDHSLSPMIHKILREQLGMSGYYHLFEVKDEENILNFTKLLQDTSVKGFNITFPYKKKITELGEGDKWVERSGVANTLAFEEKNIKLYNTDISGFDQFFTTIGGENYSNILIYGAGGAAIAVCFALLEKQNSEITIVNRSKERFSNLPEKIKSEVEFFTVNEFNKKGGKPGYLDKFEIYINATTIGYHDGNPSSTVPIPKKIQLVLDLNYKSITTKLIDEANQRGIAGYDGKGMLFHQAVDAFEIWTGKQIDRKKAYDRFLEELNERN